MHKSDVCIPVNCVCGDCVQSSTDFSLLSGGFLKHLLRPSALVLEFQVDWIRLRPGIIKLCNGVCVCVERERERERVVCVCVWREKK